MSDIVWYDIIEDEIYIGGILSAYFYSLTRFDHWDRFELLGVL